MKRNALQEVAREDIAGEWVPTGELVAWSDNPRKIDPEQVDKVAASIERWGFGAPIVARKASREIIAGHTRWAAAKKLKLPEVPVRYLDITEAEAHQLAIADNRLAEDGKWKKGPLAELLRPWREDGVDLTPLGFTEEELQKLLGENYESTVEEINVSQARAVFYMSVTGPLPAQPEVLEQIKAALAKVEGIEVSVTVSEW